MKISPNPVSRHLHNLNSSLQVSNITVNGKKIKSKRIAGIKEFMAVSQQYECNQIQNEGMNQH
jgi:hypothetical protein